MSPNIKKRGVTFVELLVGMTIFAIIMGIVANWFFTQRQYQDKFLKLSETQDRLRQAVWKVIQELKTGRQVIWPRVNSDGSARTDTVVTFKNFKGEITTFYFVPAAGEIRRCVTPNGPGTPQVDVTPVGRGLALASFTVMGVDNKLVSLHLVADHVHFLDAVRLINE